MDLCLRSVIGFRQITVISRTVVVVFFIATCLSVLGQPTSDDNESDDNEPQTSDQPTPSSSDKTSEIAEAPSQADSAKPAVRNSPQARAEFRSLMTAVHQEIDKNNWLAAQKLIEKALSIDPTSVAALELRQHIFEHLVALDFEQTLKSFSELIEKEAWVAASELAKLLGDSAKQVGPDLQRVATLATIEKDIATLMQVPSLLSKKSSANEIERIMRIVNTIDTGDRIAQQLAILKQEHMRWTTPVNITLVSDNKTEVLIRPGQPLGSFGTRHLELMPGDYVLFGRRQGYREFRQSISLQPGDLPATFVVKANKTF